jgi:hypothetical protein
MDISDFVLDLFKGMDAPERPNHKYIHRFWGGSGWEYEYAHGPAETHGLGNVPKITKESETVTPGRHSMEASAIDPEAPPEQAYKAAIEKAQAEPGTKAQLAHPALPGTQLHVEVLPNGKIQVSRGDASPDIAFAGRHTGEATNAKVFDSAASYEAWMLQTSNTITMKDPEGREWLSIVPTIGKVNRQKGEIEWSTDPKRQWKIVFHPTYPEDQRKQGRESRAESFEAAVALVKRQYDAYAKAVGKPALAQQSGGPERKHDEEDKQALQQAEPEKHPPPAGSVADHIQHGKFKWRFNAATGKAELDVTPEKKRELINQVAREYWGAIMSLGLRWTNNAFLRDQRHEHMTDLIGQEITPDMANKPPQHIFLDPASKVYQKIESALDNYDPNFKSADGTGVGFSGFLAGQNGKLAMAFREGVKPLIDRVKGEGGRLDEQDDGSNSPKRLDRYGASPEELEGREHLQDPESQEENREYRDPKVVVPVLTKLMMKWAQANPEKASIIKQAQSALRMVRSSTGDKQQQHLDDLLDVLVNQAHMADDLGKLLGKSLDADESSFVLFLSQWEVIRKAMAILTKDKNADPEHSYSHQEGDEDNPRYLWKDALGNLVRYTNAPQESDDRADHFGDAKIHSSEPDPTKNPEYYTPDGRKLTRAPDVDPAQVEWNAKYNRYDPKNLWVGRWRDPNGGAYRFTYVHSDLRALPKLQIHQQNTLTDARIPPFRQWYAKLFNSSDKIKDQMTAVALALLDQGKIRALELAAITPDVVQIDSNLITLGGRKLFGCPKMVAAIDMMKRTTPGGMPFFSVPLQTTQKVDPVVRRMMGPHYLARLVDTQGLSLLGLQTYHGTISFSREVDRAIIYYQASWEQAVNHALMVVAKEWGHDLTQEADPLRILQLVSEVLVDPVVIQVMQMNAKQQGLIGSQPSPNLPPPSIPIPFVAIDMMDRQAEEQEFSDWTHQLPMHEFAEFPEEIVDPSMVNKGLMLKEVDVHKQDGTTYRSKRWVRTEGDPRPKVGPTASYLADKPPPIPSFKSDQDSMKMSELRLVEVTGTPMWDQYSSTPALNGPGEEVVEILKKVFKEKLVPAAQRIAKTLQSSDGINHPENMKFVDINPKMTWAGGEYNRAIGLIQMSPAVAFDIHEAIKDGSNTAMSFDGVRVFVHECMHHASNVHAYEGWVLDPKDAEHRPNAALEEATTELLAQHCVHDISEHILGLPSVVVRKPIFEKVEDPYGNYEWVLAENSFVSYSPFVRRFANLIAYVDGLDSDGKISNQEFQDHVAARALEVKQKVQIIGKIAGTDHSVNMDERWDAIVNRLFDKFDLGAQLDHWMEQRSPNQVTWFRDGQPIEGDELVRRRQENDTELRNSWSTGVRDGLRRAVKMYLTKGSPFNQNADKSGLSGNPQSGSTTHVGQLDDYIRHIIETRGGGAWSDIWQADKVKKKFIGKKQFDAEGRVIPKKRKPKEPAPEPTEFEQEMAERRQWVKEDAELEARRAKERFLNTEVRA